MNLKGDETLERKADDDEPFAALAFKIMADPTSASSPTSASTAATLDKGAQV